jgi:uncharacterized protein (TIGR03067 family)
MFRRTLTASLGLALILPALLRADDAPKTQDKDLDGKWEYIYREDYGEDSLTFLFENNKVTATQRSYVDLLVDGVKHHIEDGASASGTIKVNPKSSPKTIDVMWKDGSTKGETQRGIYEVKDDVLRLCLADKDKDRPTEFPTKKYSGPQLITLKRVKK